MNGGNTTSPGLLDRVETLVKLGASAAAVTAAIGLPAVYVQYSRLGIPTSFITNEQILRAGIVPGFLFLFVGAYVLLSIQEYSKSSTWGAFMVPGILFAPIPVAGALIVFVGFGAAAAWLWWWMLWPFFWITGLELPSVHLWVATSVGLLNVVAPVIWPLIADRVNRIGMSLSKAVRWRPLTAWLEHLERETRQREATRRERAEREVARREEAPVDGEAAAAQQKRSSEFWVFAAIVMGFALYLLGGLYAIRWYMQQLDLPLGPLAEHGHILIGVAAGTLGLATCLTLMASWSLMRSEDRRKRLLVIFVNISIVVAIFGLGVWWYSTDLYPKIPAAFGGGRSEAIVVWMAAQDLPTEIREQLKGADCTATKVMVRCAALHLIHRSAEDVILASQGDAARTALLIPRESIRAFSW